MCTIIQFKCFDVIRTAISVVKDYAAPLLQPSAHCELCFPLNRTRRVVPGCKTL
jgi:hypothetical protein